MIRVTEIAEGNAGVRQTLERLATMIRGWSPAARRVAEVVVLTIPTDDSTPTLSRAGALFQWVQEHMLYVPDHPEVEEVKDPEWLLQEIEQHGWGQGDCDDMVALLGALLMAAGIRPRLAVLSERSDGEYTHVYLRVPTEIGWVAADPIHGQPFGWQVPEEARTAWEEREV